MQFCVQTLLPKLVWLQVDSTFCNIMQFCVQTLLPRIVQLWEGLQVPLVHRSRFFLAFRGRETFYYEAEHRRLIHQQTQVQHSLLVTTSKYKPRYSTASLQQKASTNPGAVQPSCNKKQAGTQVQYSVLAIRSKQKPRYSTASLQQEASRNPGTIQPPCNTKQAQT